MDTQKVVMSEQTNNANAVEESPVVDSGFVSCDDPRLQIGNEEVPSNSNSCGVNADIQIAKRNVGLKTGLNDLDDSNSNKSTARSDVATIPDQVTGLELCQQPYDYFFKQDGEGDTQLHIAIAMRLIEASLWMISVVPHACLLDLVNNNIHTALHLAVLSHEPSIARRLIVAGANPEIRSTVGNTALHLACALGDLECVRAITESLTAAEKALMVPNRQSRVPQNLDTRNFYGKTCLHIAAANGHVEIVEQLLRQGANINAPEGHSGMTCLHLAIESGHLEVVRYLSQQYRACLDAVTYAGVTTYQLAMERDPALADELAKQYGLARIVQEDNSSDTGMSESCSDSSSDDESTSSGNSQISDDQTDIYSPMVSPFMTREWVATRMRST